MIIIKNILNKNIFFQYLMNQQEGSDQQMKCTINEMRTSRNSTKIPQSL